MLNELEMAIEADDAIAVQQAIFDLSKLRNASAYLPDDIATEIIDILRREEMKTSLLSGHILNYFEYEAPNISPKAKKRCIGYLSVWGNDFKDVHCIQVIAGLMSRVYLSSMLSATEGSLA